MESFVMPLWVGATSTLCVGALAIVRGEFEERFAAGLIIVSWAFTLFTRDRDWPPLQWGGLAADLVMFAALLVIALRSRRYWPLFATAFQLLNLGTSAAPMFDHALHAWTLMTANIVWTYCLLGAVAWGAVRTPHRKSLTGIGAARRTPRRRSPTVFDLGVSPAA